jgi:hypothetical protein
MQEKHGRMLKNQQIRQKLKKTKSCERGDDGPGHKKYFQNYLPPVRACLLFEAGFSHFMQALTCRKHAFRQRNSGNYLTRIITFRVIDTIAAPVAPLAQSTALGI